MRPVADLGCGPGYVTAHLGGLGLNAFGVDLSPTMIELAREAHPDLRFEVGSMTALDIGDEALGGVLAWYSTIHTPPEELPAVLTEFHRVLAPGGHLLLAFFQADDDAEVLAQPLPQGDDGLPVVPRRRRRAVAQGRSPVRRLSREPNGRAGFPRGHLLVRKPAG